MCINRQIQGCSIHGPYKRLLAGITTFHRTHASQQPRGAAQCLPPARLNLRPRVWSVRHTRVHNQAPRRHLILTCQHRGLEGLESLTVGQVPAPRRRLLPVTTRHRPPSNRVEKVQFPPQRIDPGRRCPSSISERRERRASEIRRIFPSCSRRADQSGVRRRPQSTWTVVVARRENRDKK